jgi:pimeloyl-[acyl-carrier protein] methyl ester esterase
MNRPTLIFLSGWGMDTSIWNDIREHLGSYALRFVNWYNVQHIDEIDIRVHKAIQEEKNVILIGWSLGSLAALQAAALERECVCGVVLIGGTPRFIQASDYTPGWKPSFVERLKRSISKNAEYTLQKFDESMFSSAEQIWKLKFPNIRSSFNRDSTDSLLIGLDYLQKKDVRDILPSLHAPVLLLHGEADAICSVQGARYIAEQTKSCLHIWTEAGHAPHITKAKECAYMIQQFAEKGYRHDQQKSTAKTI